MALFLFFEALVSEQIKIVPHASAKIKVWLAAKYLQAAKPLLPSRITF